MICTVRSADGLAGSFCEICTRAPETVMMFLMVSPPFPITPATALLLTTTVCSYEPSPFGIAPTPPPTTAADGALSPAADAPYAPGFAGPW